MMYDVIFWDTIGMPYDGDTPAKQALGGSEHQAILLAEALAKRGKNVMVLNTTKESDVMGNRSRGVWYGSSEAEPRELHCNTLIVCRYSKRPTKINHRQLLVWCTDNYAPDAYKHHLDICTPMVFVSKWQQQQWKAVYSVIPNILPDFGPIEPPTNNHAYVYASSDINGRLGLTLASWREMHQGQNLFIYTPGYEGETETIRDLKEHSDWWRERFGVSYLGPKPFADIVKALKYSAGLFMVNTMTETFCLVAAMAEKMDRQVQMLCLNGYGAVRETVNSRLVTTDRRQFEANFRSPLEYTWEPNDFSEETVTSQWLKLLAPQEPAITIDSPPITQEGLEPASICWTNLIDAPTCIECGSMMVRNKHSFTCANCNHTPPSKIILNMIVKNEAHVIKRCLDSLKFIIDAWVIVDTGSTDGTQQLIKDILGDIQGILHERSWVHFAHNRSEAIKLAEEFSQHSSSLMFYDCFMLLIDADDIYRGFIHPRPLEADVYLIDIEDDDGRMRYQRQQLFRVGKGFRFEGVRHEYPTTDQPRVEGYLDSLTYVRLGGGARAKDPDTLLKDALALKKDLEIHPDDPRTAYYLAQSWKDYKEYQLALAAYRTRISLHPKGFHEECYLSLLFAGRISKGLNLSPVKDWTEAFNLCPHRAEAQYELALYYRELSEKPDAKVKYWTLAVLWGAYGQRELPNGLFVEAEIYQWKIIDELAVALTWTGDNKKALELFTQLESLVPASEKERIVKAIEHCKERLK